MNRGPSGGPRERTLEEVAEAEDLLSVIAAALEATPIDEQSLRRGVWTYVSSELGIGTLAVAVMERLTTIVEDSSPPCPARDLVMHRVLLWCVEAYFDHLGGEPYDGSADATASLVLASLTKGYTDTSERPDTSDLFL